MPRTDAFADIAISAAIAELAPETAVKQPEYTAPTARKNGLQDFVTGAAVQHAKARLAIFR